MIDLLMRKFIKENGEGTEGRKSCAALTLWVGAAVHFLLFAGKLTLGMIIHSVSVRTDAWINFAAAASVLFSLAELYLFSGNGAPKSRKAEYIAAAITAFIVFEIGFSFFSRAFTRLRNPDTVRYGIPAVILLLLSIALRRWLSVFFIRMSSKIDTRILPRSAMHSKIANSLTFAATAAVVLNQYLLNADFLVTLILSAALMLSGILIAVRAMRPTIEEEPDLSLVRSVRERVRGYSLIIGTGSLKVRFFGPGRRMIAMRVKVPQEADMAETLGTIRVIEEKVGEEFGVTLILHADPIESADQEALRLRAGLEGFIEGIDERLSFDHFHLVRGSEFSNVIFDLFVPFEYEEERTNSLIRDISRKMKELNPRCHCVIYPRKLQ